MHNKEGNVERTVEAFEQSSEITADLDGNASLCGRAGQAVNWIVCVSGVP